MMVIKTGSASVKSCRSTLVIESNINEPTKTNAPVVATLGMRRNKGDSNKEMMNSAPVTKDVKPERPPSAMPEALSTYVVTEEQPKIEPIVVASASDNIASLTWGIEPSSLMILALVDSPTSVPIVSKILIMSSVKITITVLNDN